MSVKCITETIQMVMVGRKYVPRGPHFDSPGS